MEEWIKNLAAEIFTDVKKQLEEKKKHTAYGVPQASYMLRNRRTIEVAFELKQLPEAEWFYSIKLVCSEQEWDAGGFNEYESPIMSSFNTKGPHIEQLPELIEQALRFNEEHCPPVILEFNTFANLCGHFHNAYLTDGVSYNNGYNCRHRRQEETYEEDGKCYGGCFCLSCPLGYPPETDELVKYGILSQEDAADNEDGEGDCEYIVVTDKETVQKLHMKGNYGLAVAEPYWAEPDEPEQKVYVLIGCTDLNDCINDYGESPAPARDICGIYRSREKAEKVKADMQKEADNNEALFDCDPVWYEIEEYIVQ